MSKERTDRNDGETSAIQLVGLCLSCRHMRRMNSAKGSTFYLCGRSATDPNFPKYPRLPVIACSGYEPTPPER